MAHDWSRALEPGRGGARLRVRVVPRSAKPGLDGLVEDGNGRFAVRLKLAAPPVDGRANAEAAARVADAVGLPLRDVELVFGPAAKIKVFRLAGLTVTEAAGRLAAAAPGGG